MGARGALPDEVWRALADAVGAEHVLTDPDARAGYELDWTRRFAGSTPAVVRPGSTAEVAAVVDVCRRHALALVPQGGNTGMVGGGVPLHGEVVVSLRRLRRLDPVDVEARQVTAGAGVTVAEVQAAAAAAGLRYGVDFGARGSATVGGSIATNAGGLNLLRHGGTREQVVGIEAVLGTGDVVSHLSGLVKDNTGYHLPALLCGSEGTLGIVTAARLRLVPAAPHVATAMLAFDSVADAVATARRLSAALDCLEALEVVLDDGVQLVAAAFDVAVPFGVGWPAYLVVEAASAEDPTERLGAVIGACDLVRDVAVAPDEIRRLALWRLREEHSAAIGTVGVPHKFDVTVPLGALAGFLDDVPARVAAAVPGARTWLFGHVGDGNIHVNVTGVDPDDERVDGAVLGFVAELGGSISAEHGIGAAKARWLHLSRSEAEIRAMRAIKHALDPDGILNPHVLLPVPR